MSNLSQPVQDLIRRNIDSVDTLELLLLLRRSPDSYWSADAAEQHLGLRQGAAKQRLDALVAGSLARRGSETGAYRYAAVDEQMRESVDQLADPYANQRVSVINLIYSSNLDRLRAFSNAFRLKDES